MGEAPARHGRASRARFPAPRASIWFRTLDDYHRLRELAPEGSHVVVIGGGFIGSEIAAGLVGNGCRVTMLFPEPGIGFRLFPLGLSQFVVDYYREKGVDVLTDERVASASGSRVETESGLALEADAVVAGLGVVPDTELAESAGLEVDDGIVVDEYGRVSGHENVFAAGDVARFPVARARHDDADRARGSRELARQGRRREHGRRRRSRTTTCRSSTPTCSTSATRRSGVVDSRLEIVEDWQEPNRKGVVTYVEDGKPRGVLLWNVWDKIDDARDLIRVGRGIFAV